jgi:hypothetical protein
MLGMPIRWAYYCIFRAANAPDLGDTELFLTDGRQKLRWMKEYLALTLTKELHITVQDSFMAPTIGESGTSRFDSTSARIPPGENHE